MKTQKQGIIIRAIVSLAGSANAQAQLQRSEQTATPKKAFSQAI
jgi:hypothetical protein